jgi:hypothetical protein
LVRESAISVVRSSISAGAFHGRCQLMQADYFDKNSLRDGGLREA